MFDIESCVLFITNRVSKKMADKFNDRLMLLGISRVQWLAMYFLYNDGKMSQKELAEKMDIKDSTVARLLDRMEKEEYIKREKHSKDRRITYVSLTENGENRIVELIPEGQAMSKVFSEGITDMEMEIFNKVIRKLSENSLK